MPRPKIFHAQNGPQPGNLRVKCLCGRTLDRDRTTPVTPGRICKQCARKMPKATEQTMDWNPQIHRQIAEQDGFTPADFTWLEYPVSNVRLEFNSSRHIDLSYLADLPPNTPQVNVYIEEKDRVEGVEYEDAEAGWLKIPDPVGTALAWVRFDLIDTADRAELHSSSSPSHFDGAIQGGLSATAQGVPLWDRLTPGGSIRVQVEACPEFFPWVDENGGGRLQYATNANGYFKGETAISPEYTLSMTADGELLIDGQPMPQPEAPPTPQPDQDFAKWVKDSHDKIQHEHSWYSDDVLAGELGVTAELIVDVKEGRVFVEDFFRENIERALNVWLAAL